MTSMMPTALHERIAAGESQTLECKVSFSKANIESLVAFADARWRSIGGRNRKNLADLDSDPHYAFAHDDFGDQKLVDGI